MNDRGHPTKAFHHRAKKADAGTSVHNVNQERASWQRRLWRFLPTSLRAWLIAGIDEIRYAHDLSAEIRSASHSNQIAISDRYVYDRLVDLRLHNRPIHQVNSVRAACRLMRKPKMTFLLIDTPERIHARKDELSIKQIREYQFELKNLLERLSIPYQEIHVAGRAPNPIARDIVNTIERMG